MTGRLFRQLRLNGKPISGEGIEMLKIVCVLLVFSGVFSVRYACARMLIGYLPAWQGRVEDIQYGKLTQINYAFLLPSSVGDGSLSSVDNPEKLRKLVKLAHAGGVRVAISVGGWTDLKNPGFEKLAASSSGRATFADRLAGLVRIFDLDGVDIDWEYPQEGVQSQHYLLMMQALAGKLQAEGKTLSAAVADGAEHGAGIPSGVFGLVDFLGIMAYDGDDVEGHSPFSLAESALDYWLGRGLSPAKAVLGVPFYARPSWKTYKVLLKKGADPDADRFGRDSYNGMATVARKAELARKRAGGIMIWELSGDAPGRFSLLSAIAGVLDAK
jgi:chitinase